MTAAAQRLPHALEALTTAVFQSVGTASVCWENPAGAGVFDEGAARKVANDLLEKVIEVTNLGEPSLGLATTRELLDELAARSDLDYRTISS